MQDTKSPLDIPISLFKCPADNHGLSSTLREALLWKFGVPHDWFLKVKKEEPWITGISNDLETIIQIRKSPGRPDKSFLKQTLQCITPSALFKTKKKGSEVIISKTHIVQIDIDGIEKSGRTIEQARTMISEIPSVLYVGKSVSGNGLFALLLIAEPDKLEQYAQHCFAVFSYYGFPVDTGKGQNYAHLRFLSYDENMFIREDPQPLKVTRFHTLPKKEKPKNQYYPGPQNDKTKQGLINWAVREIQGAVQGNRWATVQRVSYTMGGNGYGLPEIKEAIISSPEFSGCEDKYLTCASDCYSDGMKTPLSL